MEHGHGDKTFKANSKLGAKKHQDIGPDTQNIWNEIDHHPLFLHRKRLEKFGIITPKFIIRGD